MKIFISYKYTGVPLKKLYTQIDPIMTTLKDSNHEPFCNLYSEYFYIHNRYTTPMIMNHCFNEIRNCDIYLAFVDDIFGGGMAIECGYAYALNKKIVSLVPQSTEKFTTLTGISDEIYRYKNMEDMLSELQKIAHKL